MLIQNDRLIEVQMKLIQNCQATTTLQIFVLLTKLQVISTLQFFTREEELSIAGYVTDLSLMPGSFSKLLCLGPTLAQLSRRSRKSTTRNF